MIDNNCYNCFYEDCSVFDKPCDSCEVKHIGDKSIYTKWTAVDVFKNIDEATNKRALDVQVSGTHYKDLAIQPVEYIHANNIGYFEGNVIKYVSRWRNKNGVKDLEKAKHYIDLLIELEGKIDDKSNSDI